MSNIESVSVIKVQTKDAEKNVGSLKQQIRQLRDELGNLEEGSAEYNEKVKQMGDLMHQQSEAVANAKRATTDFGATVGNVTAVMNGGVGAITGITAGLNLMGVEMGDDTVITQKLVQALALMSSLNSVDAAIKGFKGLKAQLKATTIAQKGFNAAMKANPIGAVVIAVTALVAGLQLLYKALDKSADEAKELVKESDKLVQSLNDLNSANDFAYKMADAWGKSKKELHDLRKEQLLYNQTVADAAYDKAWEAYTKKHNEETEEALNKAREAQEKAYQAYDAFVKDSLVESVKAMTEESKKADDNAKKQLETYTEFQRRKNEIELKYRKNGDELTYNQELLILDQDRLKTLTEGSKEYDELVIANADRLNTIKKLSPEKLVSPEATEELQTLNDQLTDLGVTLDGLVPKETLAEKVDKQIEIWENYGQAISTVANEIGGVLGGLADIVGEDAESYKNLKAAEAIISTISGAVAAYMGMIQSIPGPMGIAAGVASAASVLASGYAQVKEIYAVDTNGGTNSTSGTVMTGSAKATLSNNYSNVRLTSGNGNAYDLSGLEDKIADQKVIVSVHDINNAQKEVKVTRNRNTF